MSTVVAAQAVGADSAVAPANSKEKIKLRLWTINLVNDGFGVLVSGYRDADGSGSELRNWRSTPIFHRTNARQLQTRSGTVYQLLGPIDEEAALSAGFPSKLIELFRNGFPSDWNEVLHEYYQVLKRTNPLNASHWFNNTVGRKMEKGAKEKRRSVAKRSSVGGGGGDRESLASLKARRQSRLSTLPIPEKIGEEEEEMEQDTENQPPAPVAPAPAPSKSPRGRKSSTRRVSIMPPAGHDDSQENMEVEKKEEEKKSEEKMEQEKKEEQEKMEEEEDSFRLALVPAVTTGVPTGPAKTRKLAFASNNTPARRSPRISSLVAAATPPSQGGKGRGGGERGALGTPLAIEGPKPAPLDETPKGVPLTRRRSGLLSNSFTSTPKEQRSSPPKLSFDSPLVTEKKNGETAKPPTPRRSPRASTASKAPEPTEMAEEEEEVLTASQKMMPPPPMPKTHPLADDSLGFSTTQVQRQPGDKPATSTPRGADATFKIPDMSHLARRSPAAAMSKQNLKALHDRSQWIRDWTICFVRHEGPLVDFPQFVVMGMKEGHPHEEWRTSLVRDVVGGRYCLTGSSVYRLEGSMHEQEALAKGFPRQFVDMFMDGFPNEWKKYLTQCYEFGLSLFTPQQPSPSGGRAIAPATPRIEEMQGGESDRDRSEDIGRRQAGVGGGGQRRERLLSMSPSVGQEMVSPHPPEEMFKANARRLQEARRNGLLDFEDGSSDDEEEERMRDKGEKRGKSPWEQTLANSRKRQKQNESAGSGDLQLSRSGRCVRKPMQEWAGERVRYDTDGNVIGVEPVTTVSRHAQNSDTAMLAEHFGVRSKRTPQSERSRKADDGSKAGKPLLAIEAPKKQRAKKDEEDVIRAVRVPAMVQLYRKKQLNLDDYDSDFDDDIKTERRAIGHRKRMLKQELDRVIQIERTLKDMEHKRLLKKLRRMEKEKRYSDSDEFDDDDDDEEMESGGEEDAVRFYDDEDEELDDTWREGDRPHKRSHHRLEKRRRGGKKRKGGKSGGGGGSKAKKSRVVYSSPSESEQSSSEEEEEEEEYQEERRQREKKDKERGWKKDEVDRMKIALKAVQPRCDDDWEKIGMSIGGGRTADMCKKMAETRLKYTPPAVNEDGSVMIDGVTARQGTLAYQVQANKFTSKYMTSGPQQADDFFDGAAEEFDGAEVAPLPSVAEFDANDSLLSAIRTPVAQPAKRAKGGARRTFIPEPEEDGEDTPMGRRRSSVKITTPKVMDSAERDRQARYVHHLRMQNMSMMNNTTRLGQSMIVPKKKSADILAGIEAAESKAGKGKKKMAVFAEEDGLSDDSLMNDTIE